MKSLEYAFKSYLGTQDRENNESYVHVDNLFMIVDGLGIESLADIAKEAICSVIPEAFFKHITENKNPSDALVYSIEEANKKIIEERHKLGEKIAASISLIYFHERIMYFTHLGDSRIYSYQAGELNQLTKDHTIKEEDPLAVKKYSDPRALNALTHGLGIHEKPVVQIKKYPLDKRCLIIMTTTGLTERISNREIAWLSKKLKRPVRIIQALIDLDKRKGGQANLTVGIIKYGGLTKVMRKILLTYSAFFIFLAAITGLYIMKYGSKDPITEKPAHEHPLVQEEIHKSNESTFQDETVMETEKVVVIKPIIQEKKEANVQSGVDVKSLIPDQAVDKNTVKSDITASAADEIGPDLFDRVHEFVMDWKNAWEKSAGNSGDIEGYISFYSDKFETEGFNKRTWLTDKETKNKKKSWIKIAISNVDISGPTKENLIKVNFNMNYKSSNFSGSSKKVLDLVQEGNNLKIISERTY